MSFIRAASGPCSANTCSAASRIACEVAWRRRSRNVGITVSESERVFTSYKMRSAAIRFKPNSVEPAHHRVGESAGRVRVSAKIERRFDQLELHERQLA